MSEFINKVFKKNRVIRVIELAGDKRYRDHWIIPEAVSGKEPGGMLVKLPDGRVFIFAPHHVNTYQGYKTIFVAFNDAEAYDPLDKEFNRVFSATDFGNAINGEVVKELFKTTKTAIDLPVILSIACIVAVIGLGLLLYQEISTLKEIIGNIPGGA